MLGSGRKRIPLVIEMPGRFYISGDVVFGGAAATMFHFPVLIVLNILSFPVLHDFLV